MCFYLSVRDVPPCNSVVVPRRTSNRLDWFVVVLYWYSVMRGPYSYCKLLLFASYGDMCFRIYRINEPRYDAYFDIY